MRRQTFNLGHRKTFSIVYNIDNYNLFIFFYILRLTSKLKFIYFVNINFLVNYDDVPIACNLYDMRRMACRMMCLKSLIRFSKGISQYLCKVKVDNSYRYR